MLVVSADLNETVAVRGSDEAVAVSGKPCVFSGCSGFFHPAGGAIGVVLCSPWGFEELVMRKSWRLLAEAIARAGYPCLRFDYPGTGNSSGRAIEQASISDWTAAIHAAADLVRRTTGVRRFVFVGQTLGAALAAEAARTRGDVVALHLIAPVFSGRPYIRELTATAVLVADKLGIAVEDGGGDALSVMGFAMSPSMVQSVRALDLKKVENLGVETIVVYDQLDRKAAAEATEHLRRLGAKVLVESVAPFHLMVSDATAIQPLPVDADRLVDALRATTPVVSAAPPSLPAVSHVLATDTFREEPLYFGPDGALFGMVCAPTLPREGKPAVIFLNRGLNPHIGWRRMSVDHARGLADAGITSLRIDVAGLGESRDRPGQPDAIIYSDSLLPDITAAVDALAARGHTRIMLAGVCSGAYMALTAAQTDPRVTHVVAVNAQRFVWNPKESAEDVIRFGLRSMRDYVGDVRSGGALRKLVRSRKRIAPALVFLAKRSLTNMMSQIPLRLRSIVLRGSMAARVARFFATFAARGTRVSLVFSAGDPGLMELRNYFGPEGRDLRDSNVSVSIIPDADHNLTTRRAAGWMLDHLIVIAHEHCVGDDPRPVARPTPGSQRVVCPT